LGNFSVSGTASTTIKNLLNVVELSIVASSVLNAGTNILKVAGNFSSNGNFVVSAGGTLELNGIAAQVLTVLQIHYH
jgi:hypothetical protein